MFNTLNTDCTSTIDTEAFSLCNMDTLASRLKWALRERGISQSQLARDCGLHRATVSLWVSGQTSELEGSNLAKAAEVLLVNPMWLATGKGRRESTYGLQDIEKQVAIADPSLVEIPQFDQGARMGNGGLVLQDQPGMIRRWEVSRDWLNQNVKGVTPGSQLCIVTGFGDSMKPMFNPGDPLLVDLSVRSVEYDAVYFFRVADEGFIKRIQRIPGQGLKAISANRDHYEPWTITEDMDFEVMGRVLKVWKGDDF